MNGIPELSHKEALDLIDQIVELKPYYVGLTGGEAILRDDWHILAKILIEKKINTILLTNGWNFTEEHVIKAKQVGIEEIGISLDGLEESHDFIRKKGSFKRVMKTIDILNKHSMPISIATSVNNKNILELPQIYNLLLDKMPDSWMLQSAQLLGNFRNYKELVIQPHQINDIIDFAYEVFKDKKIKIKLSDCLGYYNVKETEIRSANLPKGYDLQISVNGCSAGNKTLGIIANGNITGCISLQDKEYIEGNIRDKRLIEIYNDPNSFAWNTTLKKENLKGFCNKCQYGSYCLSGCPASSRKANDNLQLVENEYCSYNVLAKKEANKMHAITNIDKLKIKAEKAFTNKDYQLAEFYYDSLNDKLPGNTEIINKLNTLEKKLDNKHLIIKEQIKIAKD
jgi:radical SAM protein with 4Fe4S-binding SPASM domain